MSCPKMSQSVKITKNFFYTMLNLQNTQRTRIKLKRKNIFKNQNLGCIKVKKAKTSKAEKNISKMYQDINWGHLNFTRLSEKI